MCIGFFLGLVIIMITWKGYGSVFQFLFIVEKGQAWFIYNTYEKEGCGKY